MEEKNYANLIDYDLSEDPKKCKETSEEEKDSVSNRIDELKEIIRRTHDI